MTSSAYHFSFSTMDYAFSLMDKASRGSYPSDKSDYWAHITTPPMMRVVISSLQNFYTCKIAGIMWILNFTSWLAQWFMFAAVSLVCVHSGLAFNTFMSWSTDPTTPTDPQNMISFFVMSSMCLPALLRLIYKSVLFVAIDMPLATWESLMPNSLASLHRDINSLLSAPEWSPDKDDPNQTAKLTMARPHLLPHNNLIF
jgi:hypothetical protein